jgi:hypothetical protein
MKIEDFHMLHKGETCLIASIGPNLHLTPPEWFDYPSFGVNTIYRYEGWEPTYYVGVDGRLEREDGAAISEKYAHIPKFIPTPDRDTWQGENFYRFTHRLGDIYIGGWLPWHPHALTRRGIGYHRILGAVFQIAYFMGFSRMLVIGVQHKPGEESEHFWGFDRKGFQGQPSTIWFNEYRHWAHLDKGIQVLNISEDTYVPDDVIERADWREFANAKELVK